MKNTLRFVLFMVVFAFVSKPIVAQVITSTPAFPLETDSIVIVFNAAEGNKGLQGFTGDVYAHTGVITDKSTSGSDWKYVKTNWGVNSPDTKLTRLETDLYQLVIGKPRTYYNVPEGEVIQQLAFVFRSGTSTGGTWREGKDVGGSDIYQQIYEPTVNVSLVNPTGNFSFVEYNSELNFFGIGTAPEQDELTLELVIDGTQVAVVQNDTLEFTYTATEFGRKDVWLIGSDASDRRDTAFYYFVVNPEVVQENRPNGIVDGINKTSTTSVVLSLFAPYKEFVYVIGDFNNWEVRTEYMMKKHQVTTDSVHFWLEINNLDPTYEYGFQYFVDGKILTGDPYSEKILDPWNDPWINEKYEAYPNLKAYPTGKTETPVTVFQIQEEQYEWKVENFEMPSKNAMVFYELLVRDFAANATYRTLIDTIGYFKRLGINAIKLMPVAEFDGNDSWGYNPAYHMALDKYYGTKNDFKEFIDSCHANGIAVVLDVVFNHATGLSPLIRLYQNETTGAPSDNSIYAYPRERHPFNVFNDLKHDSPATNYWMKRVLKHWIEEFKVDGFRFDLSKGHYIGNTTDVGVWSSYNQWRIDHWKDNFNYLRSIDDDFMVILEHLGDNAEEKQLADHGLMLWGKMTDPYNEATMGWHDSNKSNLNGAFHVSRGWSQANLVSYMESHDEERLMYKNRQFGNSTNSNHNVKQIPVALERMKAAAAFLFTIPGPKMMWMFGELGYDVSINQSTVGGSSNSNNRTSRKPILWEYYSDPNRQSLYQTFGDILKLRTQNPVFYAQETNVTMFTSGALKRIALSHSTNNANIVGNFDVVERSMAFDFSQTGWWYDYFSGDSINVTNQSEAYVLQPGEFRIYTTTKILRETPVETSVDFENSGLPTDFALNHAYPNPFNPSTQLSYSVPTASEIMIDVYDVLGRQVAHLFRGTQQAGNYSFTWNAASLPSGMYLVRMQAGSQQFIQKVTLIK